MTTVLVRFSPVADEKRWKTALALRGDGDDPDDPNPELLSAIPETPPTIHKHDCSMLEPRIPVLFPVA
jgi:hypothetical protein